ncbi:MAG: DUF309 domain-containing protein [Thermoanaerobaculia bacterium]|nr:DUF309 domain-containing protein [Thermoanaerobaculia bacterium]
MSSELHPDLSGEERRRLLREGVDLFNRHRFFAAHEAFEEVWRSTCPEPRDLWQGLIQVAAGMYHYLERGRPDVARRVLAKGRTRLLGRPPREMGLDVAGVVARVEAWEIWLARTEGAAPSPPSIRVLDEDALV